MRGVSAARRTLPAAESRIICLAFSRWLRGPNPPKFLAVSTKLWFIAAAGQFARGGLPPHVQPGRRDDADHFPQKCCRRRAHSETSPGALLCDRGGASVPPLRIPGPLCVTARVPAISIRMWRSLLVCRVPTLRDAWWARLGSFAQGEPSVSAGWASSCRAAVRISKRSPQTFSSANWTVTLGSFFRIARRRRGWRGPANSGFHAALFLALLLRSVQVFAVLGLGLANDGLALAGRKNTGRARLLRAQATWKALALLLGL